MEVENCTFFWFFFSFSFMFKSCSGLYIRAETCNDRMEKRYNNASAVLETLLSALV